MTGNPPASREKPATSARHDVRAVLVVAVVYVLAQAVLQSTFRPLSWDEVVYLSQSAPGEVAMDWGPQRARGIVVLVAPLALFHAPAWAVRWYLMVASGAGLFLAFRNWVPVLGRLAAAAAFVFASSWVALYFGMEVFPNLPAALATVATAGATADYLLTRRRGALAGVAVGVALVAVFRPADSVWLAAALCVAAVALAWRAVPRLAGALAAGGLVGWLPWLVETGIRYGGPLAALAAAKGESASGRPRNSLHQYLNLLEGPVRLIVTDPTLTYRALAVLAVLGLLAAAAALAVPHHRRAALVAAVAAAGMAVPYLVLNTGVNLRYLLPAWALAGVVVATGAAAVWVRGGRPARAALLLLAVGWVAGNGYVDARNAGIATADQNGVYVVAAELREAAGDGPCAFASEYAFPQLSWATDCIGLELDVHGQAGQCPQGTHSLAVLAEQGYEIFALAKTRPVAEPFLQGWESWRSRLRGFGPWRLYRMPDELAGGPTVPRLPRPGEASVPCPLSRAPDASEIAPLRIGPRLQDDSTLRYRERRQQLGERGT